MCLFFKVQRYIYVSVVGAPLCLGILENLLERLSVADFLLELHF